MFAGNVVCERRKYGATHTPERYFGRDLLNPFENPAGQITFAGGYHSLISSLSRRNNKIPSFL
ncbi:MAG: hypothetical protein ACYSWZ_09890 [Planctomycetota bacterium]